MSNLAEEIAETFTRCPECGFYSVQLGAQHSCKSGYPEEPDEDEIRRRAREDPFDGDETVVMLSSTHRSYTYHEPGETGPGTICPLKSHRSFVEVTREEAQQRGRAPCQNCQRQRLRAEERAAGQEVEA